MNSRSMRMVGFFFQSEEGTNVRHLYLVCGVTSGPEAQRTAARKASAEPEIDRRNGAQLDPHWIQTQEVAQNDIGAYVLSDPLSHETASAPWAEVPQRQRQRQRRRSGTARLPHSGSHAAGVGSAATLLAERRVSPARRFDIEPDA
ncbi:hypothetical protein ACUXZZ_00215 [Streptomyces graminifolii]|uniref:hypothetical protein n=1 Tax=Streptomyces graminifolii TaxID=1266771 RepID=UPI004059AC73